MPTLSSPPSRPSLRADALKKRFAIYGDFYHRIIGDQAYACRVVLELMAHAHVPANPDEIGWMNPDLIVIMMNPGASKPLVSQGPVRRVGQTESWRPHPRVKTRPDTTQYQIMRVMAEKGFQHARVLNLSDLREPKSPRLIATIERLRTIPGGSRHTLFCDERTQERAQLMGPCGAVPVLAGWGRDKKLLPLARQCMDTLAGWHILGEPVGAEGALYAHPSPLLQSRKDHWLNGVLRQFETL